MTRRTRAGPGPRGVPEADSSAAAGPHSNLSAALELLRRCRRLTNHLERHTSKLVGLGLAECEILIRATGARVGTTTMSELALQSGLTQSGVSRVVDRLEVRRLVTCQPSAKDRRQILVLVTDAGFDLVRELLDLMEEASHEALMAEVSP
jgi:DNA-binding MarR family transcriptional regulator